MENNLIPLALLSLILISCAPKHRDYIYDDENLEKVGKAVVVTKVYNQASYGAFNVSLPQLFRITCEFLAGHESPRKDIMVGGQIYITNGEDTFILGQLKNPKKPSADLFDPTQQQQYWPLYDAVLLAPGTYKIMAYEYSYFTNLDQQIFATLPNKHKTFRFIIKPGEVVYLGDIQIIPETGTLKITQNYKAALQFMDDEHPNISHKLRPKLFNN